MPRKLLYRESYICKCEDCEYYDADEHACDARGEYLEEHIEGCWRERAVYDDYEPTTADPDFAYDNAKSEALL